MPRLDRADMFGTPPERLQSELLAVGHRRRFGAGQMVHRRDDRIDHLSVILSGRIRFSITDTEGRRITVTELPAGAIYGLAPMLAETRRSHDADALEDSTLLTIGQDTLSRLMDQHRGLRDLLLQHLATRLLQALDLVDEIQRLPLPARVAKLLATSAVGAKVDKTQASLADELGASRFAVGQAIGALARAGLVRAVYGGVEILDPAGLAARYDQTVSR